MCEDYVSGSSAPWLCCLLWFIFPTESRFCGAYLFRFREKPFHSEEVDLSLVDGAVFFFQQICVLRMSSLCEINSRASLKNDLSFAGDWTRVPSIRKQMLFLWASRPRRSTVVEIITNIFGKSLTRHLLPGVIWNHFSKASWLVLDNIFFSTYKYQQFFSEQKTGSSVQVNSWLSKDGRGGFAMLKGHS